MESNLDRIIKQHWISADNAEWIPKTDTIPLHDIREWTKSCDIEVLGYVYSMLNNSRFCIVPPISLDEYISFLKHYCGRCFRENPDGEWSDGSYSAGWDLVGVFIKLWDREDVSRSVLADLQRVDGRTLQRRRSAVANVYCASHVGALV
jgi:hypothetical protein